MPVEDLKSFKDLPKDLEGPFFADNFLTFEEFEEVSSIAILINKVIVFFGFELLEVLDNMGGRSDRGENFNFVADAFFEFFILQELLDGNYFYSVEFLI